MVTLPFLIVLVALVFHPFLPLEKFAFLASTLACCRCLCQPAYAPTWIRERECRSPRTFKSHTTTPITTTAFKIDLIDPAIGMKLLTSHNRAPTTIKTINI